MRIYITLLLCLFTVIATAQTNESDRVRPFQISFITPFGTNGIDSHLITNMVSFNILGGYSYGTRYLELGGLYNANLQYTSGLIMAGLFNYSGKTENAVQAAGLFNISMEGNKCVQLGGVFNGAKESTAQLSGVLNVTKDSTVQLSGVTNIAVGTVGTQISSVLNIAKEVNGLQLGLFNYASDMNGIPIGLFSFVKNYTGKPELEVGFSDSLNTFVSLKFGVNQFYTIFSCGINYINDPSFMAYGLGMGTQIDLFDGWGGQIELMYYQIFKDEKYYWSTESDEFSLLTQFKVKALKQFGNHLKVFAGPVFNMTHRGEKRIDLSTWSMWETGNKTKLKSWIGAEAGVSVNL